MGIWSADSDRDYMADTAQLPDELEANEPEQQEPEPRYEPFTRLEIGTLGRHYVLPSGRVVPGVTTVLSASPKPYLINWAAKLERQAASKGEVIPGSPYQHHTQKTKAGKHGADVHDLVEWELRREFQGIRVPSPWKGQKASVGFGLWRTWAGRHLVAPDPDGIEKRVGSEELDTAGTIDYLGEVMDLDSKLPSPLHAVTDWKTGTVGLDAYVQVATYRHCAIEMGLASDETYGLIVRIPRKQGEPVKHFVVKPDECDQLVEQFKHLRATWEFYFGNPYKGEIVVTLKDLVNK